MCQVNGATQIVQRYYNPNNDSYPNPILQLNPTMGFSNSQISVNNGVVTCSFTRQMSMPNATNYFDISNTQYFMLVASGPSDSSSRFCLYSII